MAGSSPLIGRTYCVKTFGCQMNLHDSERVSGLLGSCGMIEVDDADLADVVVFMTCCVREKADTRLYGQVSAMVSAPTPPSGRRIVAIGGCIAQRDGENLARQIPNADVVFGTSALAQLPGLIERAIENRGLVVDVDEQGRGFSTELPSKRDTSYHAWVPIMTGCDNFCSYCIVPHVRGRERSRTFETIVNECERLVADGVREITLLGQNVNSYGRGIYGEPRFADLIRAVDATGIERLRFTSSNPKDLNDDVIGAMAECKSVMPHLHLAVQSGSTRILKAMNRKYTREQYIELAGRLRAAIPGLALTTDIIVGFPGETEEDFLDTLSLVREADFASAFTFIYSKRAGTPAAEIEDDTPREVIQDRFDRLAHLIEEQSYAANSAFLGATVGALVEGSSKADPSVLVGHSERNQTVHFQAPEGRDPESLVGTICDIQVEEAKTWYLRGSVVGDPR